MFDEAKKKKTKRDIRGNVARESLDFLNPLNNVVLARDLPAGNFTNEEGSGGKEIVGEKAEGNDGAASASESESESESGEEKFEWDREEHSSSDSDSSASSEDEEEQALEQFIAQRQELVEELWASRGGPCELGDASARLALLNFDWSNVQAVDVLQLTRSLIDQHNRTVEMDSRKRMGKGVEDEGVGRKVQGTVVKVEVHMSEFGKERLEREKREGPSLAHLALVRRLKDAGQLEDADVEQETVLAVRKHEKERASYFYAVVFCSEIDAANFLYNELDGMDCDFAVAPLDAQFLPDSLVELPFAPVSAASSLPARYVKPEPFNSALKHTKALLSWDEGDRKKRKILRKRFTEEEMAKLDTEAFLASESDSDSGSEGGEEAIRARRALLLGDVGNVAGVGVSVAENDALSDSETIGLKKGHGEGVKGGEVTKSKKRRKDAFAIFEQKETDASDDGSDETGNSDDSENDSRDGEGEREEESSEEELVETLKTKQGTGKKSKREKLRQKREQEREKKLEAQIEMGQISAQLKSDNRFAAIAPLVSAVSPPTSQRTKGDRKRK